MMAELQVRIKFCIIISLHICPIKVMERKGYHYEKEDYVGNAGGSPNGFAVHGMRKTK